MIRIVFFLFSLFIFSCSEENDIESSGPPPFGAPDSLDIITWNIENFPKAESTLDYISSFILDLEVDIVVLQEIVSTEDLNVLIHLLGDEWVGYYAEDSDNQTLSYLINLSNIQITDTPFTILDDYAHYFAYRSPYVLQISFNNKDYTLINVHFKCCGDGDLDEGE